MASQSETTAAAPRRAHWLAAGQQRIAAFSGLLQRNWSLLLEALLITVAALYMAAPVLDFNPQRIPAGREFVLSIRGNYTWVQASECGLCALWNGTVRGGAPAFADPYTPLWHPLSILTTLIWGVVNGAKVLFFCALLLAGLSQWWLAYELRLGWIARVWTATLAIVAGHVAAKMEMGLVGLALSTASCALVLPAYLRLRQRGDMGSAVLLGVVMGLAALAGQGYMQITVALVMPPVALLFWRSNAVPARMMLQRLGLAFAIALLLAAPLLLPFVHFSGQFTKAIDAQLTSAQTWSSTLTNLVIDDPTFYITEALDKLPYPYTYVNYIGWIPLMLAGYGLFSSRNTQEWVQGGTLALVAAFALWFATAIPQLWLMERIPLPFLVEFFSRVRYPSLSAMFAAPPLIALAGIGVDRLLGLPWWKFTLGAGPSQTSQAFWQGTTSTRWILAVPLLLALSSAINFNRSWLNMIDLYPRMNEVIATLKTPDLQWVSTPFGEHFWDAAAISQGLKLSEAQRPWDWSNRSTPLAVLAAARGGPPPGLNPEVLSAIDDIAIYASPPEQRYATVLHADGNRTICVAQGKGGDIEVECNLAQPGRLTVLEHSWSGWSATLNNNGQPLLDDPWLALDLPAGVQQVSLRYRPWDVPIGMLLSLLGIGLAAIYGLRSNKSERPSPVSSQPIGESSLPHKQPPA
jgi:hypothetical protein